MHHCAVFDFDADGRHEAVVHTPAALHVLDGLDGTILWRHPLAGARYRQYDVIVADIDGDGSAEVGIVTDVSGSDEFQVYGNRAWASARSVWNQTDYSVTHVADDGAIVQSPAPAWNESAAFRGQRNKVVDGSGPPSDPGNTLKAVRAGNGVDLRWQGRNDVHTVRHHLHRHTTKTPSGPVVAVLPVPVQTYLEAAPPAARVLFYRVAGANCRGIEAP